MRPLVAVLSLVSGLLIPAAAHASFVTEPTPEKVVFSLKLPPAQRWASAMVSASMIDAPLSALAPLESLTGWKTVSPLNPRASGTWAGRVAVSPEVLLRSVIVSCLT